MNSKRQSPLCRSGLIQIYIGREFRTRDLPERFGDFRIVHTRFSSWRRSGVWERLFQTLAEDSDNEDAMIDATVVRAHQHSDGAKDTNAEHEEIGRSTGGLSTKIDGVVDALGNPTPSIFNSSSSIRLRSSRCTITDDQS